MKVIFAFMVLLVSFNAFSKNKSCRLGMLRVGVIDTGFGFKDLGHSAPLCGFGHKDFSVDQKFTGRFLTKTPVPVDAHSHGTNIVGLIDRYAKKSHVKYCFVIIKFYSEKQSASANVDASLAALEYANSLNLDVINYSGGGSDPSAEEKVSVIKFLNKGKKFFAAAGNDGKLLDGVLNSYYPAMYDPRITVVGNLDIYGIRAENSNYGPAVKVWENGVNQTAYGITLSGTSQATAITTGKAISTMDSCDR